LEGIEVASTLRPKQLTKPQTFIIESLGFGDESANRLDGKLLCEVLKLYGKNPLYYYFRTEKELMELSEQFRATGYRYLHVSCHGNNNEFCLTLDRVEFKRFAGIFKKKLDNRRLFISGCELGTDHLARSVYEKSTGMYSIIAPSNPISFNQSIAFWSAFYYRMDAYTSRKMKKEWIKAELDQLTRIFEAKMIYFWNNTKTKGISSQEFPSA
jgi:hypothetical protein